jgi:myb proto-oncogene protein
MYRTERKSTLDSLNNSLSSFHQNKPTTKTTKKWTEEEDQKLLNLAKKANGKKWKEIAECFKDKTSLQCRSRWIRIKPGIKQGRWTKQEDEQLLELFRQFGDNWSLISRRMNNRNSNQIRYHYINVLDPKNSKEKFTPNDEKILVSLHYKYGSNWKLIKRNYFPKRASDFLKNRFYSILRRNSSSIESNLKEDRPDLSDEFSDKVTNNEDQFILNDELNKSN